MEAAAQAAPEQAAQVQAVQEAQEAQAGQAHASPEQEAPHAQKTAQTLLAKLAQAEAKLDAAKLVAVQEAKVLALALAQSESSRAALLEKELKRVSEVQSGKGEKRSWSDYDINNWQYYKNLARVAFDRITSLQYNVAALSGPSQTTELWLPDINVGSASEQCPAESGSREGPVPLKFWFLGRNEFKSVLEWVLEVKGRQVAYYTGLPGGGKSYIFAALAAYLFREFAKSDQQRIIYLQGSSFVNDPEQSLSQALLLAYPESEWESFPPKESLKDWICRRKQNLLFLVDDCEVFDRGLKDNNTASTLEKRETAYSLLLSLAMGGHRVVKCCSIRSEAYEKITGMKCPPYLIASPIFSEEELKEYLRHLKADTYAKIFDTNGQLKMPHGKSQWDSLMASTGGNPRLVHLYTFSLEDFEKRIEALGTEIWKFISTPGQDLIAFMNVVAGNSVDKWMPKAMLSKCFYRKDGNGACISDRLIQVTRKLLAKVEGISSQADRFRALECWVQSVGQETNKARLGHNAETAAILAVKLHTSIQFRFPDQDGNEVHLKINLKPKVVVETLLDDFAFCDMLSQGVLYIPTNWRHKGLDFYYTDEAYVIGFQVTVACDPVRSHPKTYTEFEQITRDDARRKYLIWVAQRVYYSVRLHGDIIEIFCRFEDLHHNLRRFDEAGIRIDKEKDKATATTATTAETTGTPSPSTNWDSESLTATATRTATRTASTGKLACKAIAKTTGKRCGKLAKTGGFCHVHQNRQH